MTFPHRDTPPPDPSAPTCPSCGVVAAVGTWPAGYEVKDWWCMECLYAGAHRLHEEAKEATAKWRISKRARAVTRPNLVQSLHEKVPSHLSWEQAEGVADPV